MNDHARFAPSAAHRWLNCTASVSAAECYHDEHGEAAMEGTAAHWLLERCLVDGGDPVDFLGRTIVVREDAVERRFVVTKEMAYDVETGVGFIREVASAPGLSGVEARIDLSFIEVNQFGTCDLWHWSQDGVLTICDFKYGRTNVEAENNPQLMIYAAGVMNNEFLRARLDVIKSVRLVILQPRSVAAVPRIKTWTVTPDVIAAIVPLAQERILEANHQPRFEMGEWCKYCPALGDCPASQRESLALVPLINSLPDLTPKDAARILAKKDLLEKIVKKAEAVALDAMLHGTKLPGLKLVTSRRHRQWRDESLARQALVDVAGDEALQLVTPAQADKLGAEAKRVVAEFAFTPDGDPAVGAENDRRALYVPKTATAMFGAGG
jgi:hypothetical protein